MIVPFVDHQVKEGNISFGLTSYGYDIRITDEFKIFASSSKEIIDPKKLSNTSFKEIKAETCLIPPNSFVLARSVEYFKIPRDILTICLGKSTYARCGIIVNVTPFEPEWEGYATLEISNTSPQLAKIYANEGIAQVIFLQSDESCIVSYKDKKGQYQAQKEITLPKVLNNA